LRDPEQFGSARIENNTLTFANGYDICPDVLRFYCERGDIATREETDAAFDALLREAAPRAAAVAETHPKYGK
jgi:hypothetical protein